MNRREALAKLSVGGAIAVGGSMVLSSTNVAYAASGTAPSGTIQTNSVSGSSWTVELVLGPSTCVEQSRTWSYSVVALSPRRSIVVGGNSSAATYQVTKYNNGNNLTNWKSGDQVSFSVTVVFDCGTVSYGPTTLTV